MPAFFLSLADRSHPVVSGRRSNKVRVAEGPVSIAILSVDRLREIHRGVMAFLEELGEPVLDLGEKESELLENAVGQQYGLSGEGPLAVSAALTAALFELRPFYEGLGATTLAALLLLLDRNGLELNRVPHDELHTVLTATADGQIERIPRGKGEAPDTLFEALTSWLAARTRKPEREDYPLTPAILARLVGDLILVETEEGGFELCRETVRSEKRIFGLGTRRTSSAMALCRLSAPGQLGLFTVAAVREARQTCGIEPQAFYDAPARLDSFLRQYRPLLPRLVRL